MELLLNDCSISQFDCFHSNLYHLLLNFHRIIQRPYLSLIEIQLSLFRIRLNKQLYHCSELNCFDSYLCYSKLDHSITRRIKTSIAHQVVVSTINIHPVFLFRKYHKYILVTSLIVSRILYKRLETRLEGDLFPPLLSLSPPFFLPSSPRDIQTATKLLSWPSISLHEDLSLARSRQARPARLAKCLQARSFCPRQLCVMLLSWQAVLQRSSVRPLRLMGTISTILRAEDKTGQWCIIGDRRN